MGADFWFVDLSSVLGTWLSVDTPGFSSFVVSAVALFHELLHRCNYSRHRSKVDSGEFAVAGAV